MTAVPRASSLRTKLRRDVVRQWPQFAAIVVTITLGVALFAASYDGFRNLQASYDNMHVELRSADLWVTGGDTGAIAGAASGTSGVAAVATRVQADVPLRVGGRDKLRGRVVGVPGDGQPELNQLLVLDGSYLRDGRTALVEQHMADHFELSPGDTVEAWDGSAWTDLTVTGAAASPEYIWPARSRQDTITLPDQFGVLFVPPDVAQQLAGTDANQVLVRLGEAAEPGTLDELAALARELGATEVLTREEQPSNAVLQEDIDGFSQMSVAFPVLFLLAAGMATYVLVTRRVQSERTVIGMMLANGMSRGRVLRHYLGYGLAAGAVGGVLGVVAGVAAARSMTDAYLGFIDLPAQAAVFDIRWVTVLGGVAFGLIAGALSVVAPALLASRVEPADAMRGVVPASSGRRSLLERIVPPLRRLPARWRLVLRNIGRNRRRTGYTVTGVTLSLLLVLSSWSLLDTMDALLHRQFDEVQRQDARVDLAGPQQPAVLDEIRAVDGVAEVEPMLAVPVALQAEGGGYASVLRALPRGTDLHGFIRPDGSETSLPGDGVLVGTGARPILDAEPGDTLQLRVAEQGVAFETDLPLAGYVDEPLGTFSYTSIDQAEQLAGRDLPITSALVRYEEGADRDAVRRVVTDLGVVAAYEDSQALARLFEEFTGLFYGFVGGMLLLGALMAFAIMFTTMSVNIMERSREVATLRASGVHLGQLARMISSENLIMTLLGVVPGVVAGVIGGEALMRSFSSDLFQLDLVVQPATVLIAVGAIVAVAALSQWPSLRAMRRLDIAGVVRERDM
ncbi:MAG: ABC transporter permease [Actinomycetota bacterium]